MNLFSLPSFVSRSSTHFSQLISQIGQNWAKSGLLEKHSEVSTDVRIDSTDSVLKELNQRKKYKLASLLSGYFYLESLPFQKGFRVRGQLAHLSTPLCRQGPVAREESGAQNKKVGGGE